MGTGLAASRPLGADLGATRANNFPRQANGYGQAGGQHPRSRSNRTTLNAIQVITAQKAGDSNPSEHLRARPLEVISGILFALFREDVLQPA